jgi:putative FmdB family regulatory protein
MPTYEMECKNCHTHWDMNVAYGSAIIYTNCPKCKSNKVKKVISLVPIMFRGKGFYRTDNPKGKK